MALFKKEICPVCGNIVKGAMFQNKIKDKKTLCADCGAKIDMEVSMLPFQTAEDIKEHLIYREENLNLFKNFSITKELKCGNSYLREDAQMGKWYYSYCEKNPINPPLFDYDEIIDYELTEDGELVAKGGIGSAVVGGAMFGAVGAIVGSNVGKKKTKTVIKDITLRVSLKNKYIQQIKINFIPGGIDVKSGSMSYNTYKYAADSAVSFFDNLCSKAKETATTSTQTASMSSADEILKFKNLLDSGIITQEEFEAKKKELLGL